MAKPPKDHKPRTRKSKAEPPHEPAPELISVNDGFHILLAGQQPPYLARHRFEEAILTNAVRLWVNDEKGVMVAVNPNFIASSLRVAARTEPDGRWSARIEPTKALVPGEYIWRVTRAEVEALLGAILESSDEQKSKPKLLSNEEWAKQEFNRMVADGEIPAAIGVRALSFKLVEPMKAAAAKRIVRKALEQKTIERALSQKWRIGRSSEG